MDKRSWLLAVCFMFKWWNASNSTEWSITEENLVCGDLLIVTFYVKWGVLRPMGLKSPIWPCVMVLLFSCLLTLYDFPSFVWLFPCLVCSFPAPCVTISPMLCVTFFPRSCATFVQVLCDFFPFLVHLVFHVLCNFFFNVLCDFSHVLCYFQNILLPPHTSLAACWSVYLLGDSTLSLCLDASNIF